MEITPERVSKYGKSVINNLYILLKITGIYDSLNETILNVAGRLIADMQMLVQDEDEFTIKIIHNTFFIEGMRIKGGIADVEGFTYLAAELQKKSIGSLDFRLPVSAENIVNFVYALREGKEASDIQSALEQKLSTGIVLGGPVILQEGEEIDLRDNLAVARRAYVKAVSALKETDNALKSGRRTKLKDVKRALQFLVDSILADESHLLNIVFSKRFDQYYYFHPVNVSILSVALGRRLGFERVQLRTLAVSAFFHDFGKVLIPISILDKKDAFTPKEEELIRRHPVDGVKVLLRAFGLNETSILSMIVSFEHHMKLDHSGYPEFPGTKIPNLFSRIVSIADEFDSLISGRVYERKRHPLNDALDKICKGNGKTFDPSFVKALISLFQ